MITIDKLKEFGANTAEGLERCCGMEALYLKLVKMVPDEKNFVLLKNALDENDLDTAFQAAHALKGVLGNLSLTPMFKISVEITELLRSRTHTDYTPLLNKLFELKDKLAALCE